MQTFALHPRLAADSHVVGNLPLSTVLLFDERRYPWVILVPRVASIREIHELSAPQRQALLDESCAVGEFLLKTFSGDKLNIGALGNVVPQLHIHHVVRNVADPAWPAPVWGHSPREPYARDACLERLEAIRVGLGLA